MKKTLAFLVLVALATSCGSTLTVQGSVSYDGTPVESGHINFVSFDGQGPGGGAPVKKGKFRLAGLLTPGKYKMNVVGDRVVPAPAGVHLSGDMKAGDPMTVGDLIPDDAIGNFQVVEILASSDTLNFDLKKPRP